MRVAGLAVAKKCLFYGRIWSCCVVPVNVGNPRTVDAVENTADADC